MIDTSKVDFSNFLKTYQKLDSLYNEYCNGHKACTECLLNNSFPCKLYFGYLVGTLDGMNEAYNQAIIDYLHQFSRENFNKYTDDDWINYNNMSLMLYDVAEQLMKGKK